MFRNASTASSLRASRRLRWGLLSIWLWTGAVAQAAVFTVGSPVGPGQCSHGTIQSAINAAESSAGADTVRLTRSLTYEPEANSITTSQELTVEGGFATCTQAGSDGVSTTVSGAGGAQDPVFRITANTGAIVRLRHLTISGGDEDGAGRGGGIYFRGNGVLEIRDSVVSSNLAGYGGGIYAEGTGSDAEVVIGANVTVVGNTARYSGGGVYADQVELSMLEPGSVLFNNEALGQDETGGYGGGLVVFGGNRPSYAYIGSGRANTGAISGNSAVYGGGVAIGGRSSDSLSYEQAELHLFTTDPAQPARISNNSASLRGGAIHAQPFASSFDGRVIAIARLWNAQLDNNDAPAGAAVYLQTADEPLLTFGSGAQLRVNDVTDWPAAAVPCSAGTYCGRITGNVANSGSAFSGAGTVIHLDTLANALIGDQHPVSGPTLPRGGILIDGNSGRHLIGATPGSGGKTALLRNTVIHGNTLSQDLVLLASADDELYISDSTIAGNTIGLDRILSTIDAHVTLSRSILWQPGLTTLSRSGGTLAVDHVIASEVASLVGGGIDVILRNPRFVDPARGDFGLRAGSPAIDFAPPVVGDDRDALARPRDQDLPVAANQFGVRDVGAFERPALLPLVLQPDFDFADLRLWTRFAGEWDGTQNVSGDAGSGSWRFSITGTETPRFFVGQQCIHLPGPGRYRLNGRGKGGGSTIPSRDFAVLTWEFRRNGTEQCNVGAADVSGEITIGSGTSWGQAAQPAIIEVPEFEWGEDSSITITLTAVDGGITSPRSISAWFDGITLDLDQDGASAEEVFEDGFE